MADLVAAVKKYALEHYEQNGWDYIIECYSDKDIEEMIGNTKTEQGAIRKVARASGIHHRAAYRKDIEGA